MIWASQVTKDVDRADDGRGEEDLAAVGRYDEAAAGETPDGNSLTPHFNNQLCVDSNDVSLTKKISKDFLSRPILRRIPYSHYRSDDRFN